jgi:hypothetical protein
VICPRCGADEKMSAKVYGLTASVGNSPPREGSIVVCLRCGHGLRVEPGGALVLMSEEDISELPEDQRLVVERVLYSVAKMNSDLGDPDQ